MKEDEEFLAVEPDFSEKEKDLERFKKDELKKLEKLVKKEVHEWEDLFLSNPSLSKSEAGVAALAEKITKQLNDGARKALKKAVAAEN